MNTKYSRKLLAWSTAFCVSACLVQPVHAARTVDLNKAAAKTAFGGGKFFTGAGAADAEHSVASYKVDAADKTKTKLAKVPLAPDAGVSVNGVVGAGPLHGKVITALAATADGSKLVAVDAAAPTKVYMITDTAEGKAVLQNKEAVKRFRTGGGVDNAYKATSVAVTDAEIKIKDAAGGAGTPEVKKRLVFAPVASDAGKFQAATGIQVLTQEADQLAVVKYNNLSTTVAAGNNALHIRPEEVKIGVNLPTFENENKIHLHWNNHLNKLYFGLEAVKTGVAVGDGAFAVGMCKIDPTGNGSIAYEAIANNNVFQVGQKGVIGHINQLSSHKVFSVYHVNSLRTSTNKNYLVVNSSLSAGADYANNLKTHVAALPLKANGKIAKIDTATGLVTDFMADADADSLNNTSGTSKPVAVGASMKYLSSTEKAPIAHLATGLDSVYVSLAGDRLDGALPTHSNEAGLFKSMALFDADGNVRSWTPWSRVTPPVATGNPTGNADALKGMYKVHGFGVDEQTGAAWFVADTAGGVAGDPQKRVALTSWGVGDATAHAGDANKSLAVVTDTAKTDHRITAAAHFDESTVGFKQAAAGAKDGEYQFISLSAIATDEKLFLVQTGARSTAEAGDANAFGAVLDLSAASKKIDIAGYGDVIKDQVGRVSSIELARSQVADKGWLFVGGEKGISVLRKADGKGFNSNTGLENLDDTAAGAGWPAGGYKFAKLAGDSVAGITNVRKLAADGTYLYALTPNKLYRITMENDKFKDTDIANFNAANVKLLADLDQGTKFKPQDAAPKDLSMNSARDEFFDFVLLDNTIGGGGAKKIALATTQGLLVNQTEVDAAAGGGAAAFGGTFEESGDSVWKRVSDDFSTVLRMDVVNVERGNKYNTIGATANQKDCNLYITALDDEKKYVCVYRVDVQGGGNVKLVDANPAGAKHMYKLGSVSDVLAGRVDINMPADLMASYDLYAPAGKRVEAVQMVPTAEQFAAAWDAGAELDYGLEFTSLRDAVSGSVIQDTSGAQYVFGDFGTLART